MLSGAKRGDRLPASFMDSRLGHGRHLRRQSARCCRSLALEAPPIIRTNARCLKGGGAANRRWRRKLKLGAAQFKQEPVPRKASFDGLVWRAGQAASLASGWGDYYRRCCR